MLFYIVGIINIDTFNFLRLRMSRFYCPFCSSRYQFHKTRSDGVLICGQCGDPLIKKSLIKSRRIFGLVALSAFLAPLIIMIVFLLNDFNNERPLINAESLVLLTLN